MVACRFICYICLIFNAWAFAESQTILTPKQLSSAIANENAADVISALSANSVYIENESEFIGRSAIQNALEIFWESNGTCRYSLKHQGESPNGATFSIGELRSKDKRYRLQVFLKNNLISEINIEDI